MTRNRIATLVLGAALSSVAVGCGGTTTNSNLNGNTAPSNTGVVTNNNGNTNTAGVATTGNYNTTGGNTDLTRADFDRDRARYEAEARSAGRKIGSGANDLWIFTKTKTALAAASDLRDSTINVDVDNNVVTLSGTVANAAQKNKASLTAQGIDGVTRVNADNLKVSANDSLLNTNGNTGGAANRNGNTNRAGNTNR